MAPRWHPRTGDKELWGPDARLPSTTHPLALA
jgi:hypothetical protein